MHPLWKRAWWFLKKSKLELPYDPSIAHLGIYSRIEIFYNPMFIAPVFTIANTWKQAKGPPTDEWIKKMWYIYTMGYDSALRFCLKNGKYM